MNARAVAYVLIFLMGTDLFAQTSSTRVWDRFWPTYDPSLVVFFPPDGKLESYKSDPGSVPQYERELRKVFRSDTELAQYVCAAVQVRKPNESAWRFPNYDAIRKVQSAVCNEFPPNDAIRKEVDRLFNAPPPTPRSARKKVADERRVTMDEVRRLIANGVYLPPPADADSWRQGTAGRDYSSDVLAAFEADPRLAAVACESAETVGRSVTDPNLVPLRDKLLQVCASFPVEKMVAAAEAARHERVFAWLRGLVNTYTDQAATMTEDARRSEVETIANSIAQTVGGVPRFQLALKTIALVPQDDTGPFLTLTYIDEAGSSSDPGAQPKDVRRFLDEFYARNSKMSSDAINWKRGWRAYLLMTGQLTKARDIAREIVAAKRGGSALDRIHLAAIDRLTGNESSFDQINADCPEPDARYVQQFGRPPLRAKYCQDVVSSISQRALTLLGPGAPPALRQLFAETNRIAPAAPVVAAAPQPVSTRVSPTDEEVARLSAILNSELDAARLKSEALRAGEAAVFIESLGNIWGDEGIAAGFRVMALTPWDDRGPWIVISALRAFPAGDDPRLAAARAAGQVIGDHKTRTAALQILNGLYRRRVETGADKNEWKRGWRGFVMYTGALTDALRVSRELISLPSDPEHSPRDQVILAMLERASGNPEPLKKLMANCPPAAPSYVRKYGSGNDYCRSVAFGIAYRALDVLRTRSPVAFKDVILETMKQEWGQIRMGLGALQSADPEMARRQWERVLESPPRDMPAGAERDVLSSLLQIAEKKGDHRGAIAIVDRYLAEADLRDPGFDPQSWRELAASPDAGVYRSQSFLYMMIEAKVMNAMHIGNHALAQRTVETLLTLTSETGDIGNVRRLLEQMAELMIRSGGQSAAAGRRILGYLATHQLDQTSKQRLDHLLRKLAASGEVAKLEPARTPWDSPERPDLRKPAGRREPKVRT